MKWGTLQSAPAIVFGRQPMANLVVNTLTIQGSFSLADLLSWVGQCIPDVPEKAKEDEVTFYFQSTFQVRGGRQQRVEPVSYLYIVCSFVVLLGVFTFNSQGKIPPLPEVLKEELGLKIVIRRKIGRGGVGLVPPPPTGFWGLGGRVDPLRVTIF